MTSLADKDEVIADFKQLVDDGVYPTPLNG